MSITTTSGTVLNGLYVGSSTPVANQKGLLIDNKYFIPLVESSSSGTDTSDATATASDILQDKTAYVNGEKITGTISSYTGSSLIIPGVEDKVLSTAEGIYLPKAVKVAGESDLLAENIKKGVSIFGIVGTLESGGGSSAEYYKCASVSSGASQPEGYNLTVEFYGFTINEAGTNYDKDSEKTVIRMTMQDTSASGLDRVWVSDDGAWKLMKYEVPSSHISWGLYKTSRGDFEYFVDAWSVINQDAMSAAWEKGETYSDDVDPWVHTRMTWSDDPALTDLTWTVSPAVSGGNTWSGYKATQGDDGKYSFVETATTGLSYDGGFTPQVGIIYSQDAKVKVAQLMEATAAIPQDGLVFWMPFNGNTEPAVGAVAVAGSMGAITYNTKNGITYTVLPGTSGWRIYSSGTTDFSLGSSYSYICYYRDDSDHTKPRRFLLNMNLGSNYQNTYVPNSINKLTVCESKKDSTSGQWHFLCIRSNGSTASIKGTIDTYTWTSNNVPGNSPARYDSFVAAPSDWATSSIGEYWHGGIFDFAIYNRILTDEEVTALYQRVIPLQS